MTLALFINVLIIIIIIIIFASVRDVAEAETGEY